MRRQVDGVEGAGKGAEPAEVLLASHERTKHHLDHYARGPGYLDWASQPNPFRTFAGAPALDLPRLADRLAAPAAELYRPPRSAGPQPSLETVASLFEL